MPRRIGDILREQRGLSDVLIEAAMEKHAGSGLRTGEVLLRENIISVEDLLNALSEQFAIPVFRGDLDTQVDPHLFQRFPVAFLKRHRILPLSLLDAVLLVAVNDPTDMSAADELAAELDASLRVVLYSEAAIARTISRLQEETASTPERMIDDLSVEDLERFTLGFDEPENLLDSVDDAPIIKLVNLVFSHALRDRASDIHIEPFERELKVRYRIDGFLYDRLNPPKSLQSAIISRLKVMASLDIAEKRLPQDGRIKLRIGEKDIDVRVSVLPTSHGERVAMRLLDRSSILLGLDDIGLEHAELEYIRRTIRSANGIILVTGPTGSGKTTTLYAALNEINTMDKNIITVEDPIEYQLRGVSQIQVNPKIELTFARGLRSILRQDPDIIMIGEIRDLETAEIAIQASLTGHLVFSTLHTNDAASAFTRLVDMGIEPFLVSSSLLSIIAQRLVRVLCPQCKVAFRPEPALIKNIGLDLPADGKGVTLYKAAACDHCFQTGFIGRTGLYEILPLNAAIQHKIMDGSDANEIKVTAVAGGMRTLKMSGARKIVQGITAIEEVLRVVND